MASALIVDFGGVLTTNVFQSFKQFAQAEGLDPDTVKRAFREDPEALGLLRRLERGELTEEACTLTIDHNALLKLLGVKDSFEARRRLREALERYENLHFVEVLFRQSKKGLKKTGRANLNRVLTYQEAETVTGGTLGWGTHLRVAVEFDYSFIDGLRRGTLFGVDWQRVISISEVEPPVGV